MAVYSRTSGLPVRAWTRRAGTGPSSRADTLSLTVAVMIGSAALAALLLYHVSYAAGVAGGALIFALSIHRIEVAFAAFVFAGMVAPRFVGTGPWVPMLALVTALGFGSQLILRRKVPPVIGPLMAAYCSVYVLAALHAGPAHASVISLAKYVAPPIFAVVTASLATDPQLRRRLLIFILVGAFVQVPFTVVELLRFGVHLGTASANQSADTVRGLVGSSTSLGLIEVTCAAVLIAMVLARVGRQLPLILGAGILLSMPVLASMRAFIILIPVAFGLLALTSLGGPPGVVRRRAWLAAGMVIAAVPASVFGLSLLYPGAATPLKSPSSVLAYLNSSKGQSYTGPTPNRGVAIHNATTLAFGSNLPTMMLGRGPGAAQLTVLNGRLHPFALQKDLLLTPVQTTNGVWIARTLVEAGVLGVVGFVGLLLVISLMPFRAMKAFRPGELDLALLLMMPALAGVIAVGAVDFTALANQPYATVFWILVALGFAAAADGSRRLATDRRNLARARSGFTHPEDRHRPSPPRRIPDRTGHGSAQPQAPLSSVIRRGAHHPAPQHGSMGLGEIADEVAGCPLCSSTASDIGETYTYEAIWQRLESKYGTKFSADVVARHSPQAITSLCRCHGCGLEYFDPSVPGDASFYDELMASVPYEPSRWEFDVVARRLSGASSVLDLGCGRGAFLRGIRAQHPDLRVAGVDLNSNAIGVLRAEGIEAYVADATEITDRHAEAFDVVCAFQILEHVGEPRALIDAATQLLAPGGRLFVSVPNRERIGRSALEPLDCPPHHVTRWAPEQLAYIADELDLELHSLSFEDPTAVAVRMPYRERAEQSMAWLGPQAASLFGRINALGRLQVPKLRHEVQLRRGDYRRRGWYGHTMLAELHRRG